METAKEPIEEIFERSKGLIKTNFELYRLKAILKLSYVISAAASSIIIISFFCIFFLLANIGLALWMGSILEKDYLGFFAIAGIYAILGLIVILFRRSWIKIPVRNAFINQMLNEE